VNILVINGPNLNLLGVRKPEVYGIASLEDINKYISDYFKNTVVEFFQSNHEGDIIDKIQQAGKRYEGIVINPGAYTHYSYAIRDAIEDSNLPVVEVHISNISKREEFRQKSVISPVCKGTITGFGKYGYVMAVRAIVHRLSQRKKEH